MNSDQSLPQDMADIEMIEEPLKIMVGSARNFRSVQMPGSHYDRTLKLDVWSQSEDQGYSQSWDLIFRYSPSQKEKELLKKIERTKVAMRNSLELFSKIHETSGSVDQQQLQQIETDRNTSRDNDGNNTVNDTNSFYSLNTTRQNSKQIVNTINSTQQVSSPSDLNSSAKSGWLEICLSAEENSDMNTEYKTMATQPPTTPSEQENFIKKRKLVVEQYDSPATNTTRSNESFAALCSNVQQQPAIERQCINNVLKTTNMQNIDNDNNIKVGKSADFSLLIQASIDLENAMVSIGPNETKIPAKVYHNINWASASSATRKLLMTIFNRKILATHSMTGKPSPAFKDQGKPVKKMLDPLVIADIVYVVTRKCNVSDKVVRNAITSKCADENKTMKLRMNKRKEMSEINKENQTE